MSSGGTKRGTKVSILSGEQEIKAVAAPLVAATLKKSLLLNPLLFSNFTGSWRWVKLK